jgi:methylglyoxal synthase
MLLRVTVAVPLLTVNVNALVIVCPVEQLPVACTVKAADVTAVVGVPLMTPAEESVNPAGSEPLTTDQVKGAELAGVAANVCEYAVPTVPAVNDDAVVMEIAGQPITNVNALVAICPAEQLPVARTVTGKLPPAPVGVPLIRPAEERVSPVGSAPLSMAHV